jgi:hypothetical protein
MIRCMHLEYTIGRKRPTPHPLPLSTTLEKPMRSKVTHYNYVDLSFFLEVVLCAPGVLAGNTAKSWISKRRRERKKGDALESRITGLHAPRRADYHGLGALGQDVEAVLFDGGMESADHRYARIPKVPHAVIRLEDGHTRTADRTGYPGHLFFQDVRRSVCRTKWQHRGSVSTAQVYVQSLRQLCIIARRCSLPALLPRLSVVFFSL